MCEIVHTLGNTVVGKNTVMSWTIHFHIQMRYKGNVTHQTEYRNYEGWLIKFYSEGI